MIIAQSNNSTNSTLAKFCSVAILAVGLTTSSLNNDYRALDPIAYVANHTPKIGETTTPNTKEMVISDKTTYEKACGLFDGELRVFTKEESEIYNIGLGNIYKPIGVNIRDLC